MLPHQELVGSPLEMETQHRNSKDVLYFGIDVQVVVFVGERRRLNCETHGRRIVPLNIALEVRPKALDAPVIIREFSAATAGIDGITTNKFLLARVFQVLPAGHPDDGAG